MDGQEMMAAICELKKKNENLMRELEKLKGGNAGDEDSSDLRPASERHGHDAEADGGHADGQVMGDG